MRVQPRHPGELNRVRDLVQRHPGHEFLLVGVERAHGLAEVRQHEQKPRRAVGNGLVEQHQLVLAEHALTEIAEHHAHLGGEQEAHPDLHRGTQRPEALAGPLEHGVEQRSHRSDVADHPLAPADPLRLGQRPRGLQAGVCDHARLGLGSDRRQVDRRHLPVAGARDKRRDPLSHDPVDHVAGILSSSWSVASERAAITGELGAASSGASSGFGQLGKLTKPPASRTIS